MVAYIAFFRALLYNRDSAPLLFPSKEAAHIRQGAVGLLLGISFAFLLGSLLIAIGITLIFSPHL